MPAWPAKVQLYTYVTVIQPFTLQLFRVISSLMSNIGRFRSFPYTIHDLPRRAVESEGILGGVGVGKNIPTPTPTSI
jgi:hypothetical protein